VIEEPLVPDSSGYFKARGVLGGTLRADFDGTVSGDSLRLRITSYPAAYPRQISWLPFAWRSNSKPRRRSRLATSE
jgi:hypothetical protein